MSKILIENIKVYAYHGCLKEENIIGSDYLIDLMIEFDMQMAAQSDDLKHTVNYAELNELVHRQMAIKSNLLEHVAARILNGIIEEFPAVTHCEIKLSKVNPPMGGDVEKVSVIQNLTRK